LFGGPPAIFAIFVARVQRKTLLLYLSIGRGWTYATALGAGLGTAAGFGASITLIPAEFGRDTALTVISIGRGSDIGLAQCFYLRPSVPRAEWWIAAYPTSIFLAAP